MLPSIITRCSRVPRQARINTVIARHRKVVIRRVALPADIEGNLSAGIYFQVAKVSTSAERKPSKNDYVTPTSTFERDDTRSSWRRMAMLSRVFDCCQRVEDGRRQVQTARV